MEPTRVPDACSLTEPDFEDRIAWIREAVLPHALSRDPLPDGVSLRFEPDAELRERLERLVALESDCCDPEAIRFSLHAEPDGRGLRLEARGVDPGHSVFASSAAAPGTSVFAESAPASGGVRRLAKAGGLGALGAFGLLCGLPMAITAIAGAAVAAPLAGLESPVTLAAGSLAFAAAAWLVLRRRERRCC